MSDFTKRVFTEEDNKRFSEFMNKWMKDHPIKPKKELSDFDHTDEAKEQIEINLDQTINYYYENMMIGEQ